MGQFVTDIAALGAFSTAAYKILLGWYRFRASRNKRVIQLGPFEALGQALKAAAAKGGRDTAEWGRGALASGHAHVVASWNAMPAASKVALVEDMLQIAVLTGQLSDVKAVREGRLKWNQLSQREQIDVLAALDSLTLDGLGQALKEAAPELAESWLWQVTEVPPLLAEEPVLSEPCTAELALLTKAFDKADKAVKEVLNAERVRHLEALSQAIGPLNAAPATASLKELKSLVTDGMSAHLGPEALTLLTQQLKTALKALVQSEDGGLLAAAEAKEAAKKMDAQVDAKAVEDRLAKEQAAHTAARATEVAHLVQVSTAPSQWSPSAPLALKVALVELLLDEVSAAQEGDAGLDKLVDAAQKAVSKLPLPDTDGLSERVQSLTAAISAKPTTPSDTPEPIANGTSETGDDDTPAAPAAPSVTGPAAAKELLAVLLDALKDKLPAEPEGLSGDEGVVSSLVRGILSRVVASTTPGGVMAAAGAGVASLQRADVVAAIRAEATRKAEAHRQPALAQIESEAQSVRSLLASKVLTTQLADAEAGSEGVTSGQRLALAAAYIKNVVLPGSGSSLAVGTQRALGLLSPETDAQPLTSGATAAVAHAQQLASQLSLATDLSSGLDLGPGLVTLLDRLDGFCSTAPTGDVATPVLNGHAKGEGEEGEEEEEKANGEVHEEEEAAVKGLTAEQVSKAQQLVASLLADGLVLLELSGQESRKLSLFKTSVDGCSTSASADQVIFNRHLTSLKDLAGQLGPIMVALEAKCGAASGARQQALLGIKTSAVSSYKALQELLALEGNVRTSSVDSLSEIRDIVYGLKPQRSSALLESGLARLDGVKAKAEGVVGWVAALQGSEDAVSEVMVMEEQVDRVVSTLRVWADWVRLRETALTITPADATTAEEDADIELPPLQELQDMHEGEATFIDMYAMPGAEDNGSDEGEKRDVEASTYAQQGDEEEELTQRQAEYQERLDGWQKQGEKLIARGQVAVILMVGDVQGSGDLKSTRDVGLPSTKSALQLFAERLLKVQQLAATAVMGEGAGIVRPLDWYIVGSSDSLALVRSLLLGSGYFGLQPSQVHLVESDGVTRPALGPDLKIVMEAPGRMAKSPTCSGDVWSYLHAAGQLKALRQRGARVVEVHTVEDNLMARPADPLFVGCFFEQQLDAAAKAGDPAGLMHVYEGYAAMLATSKAAQAFSRYVSGLGTYAFSSEFIKGVEGVLRERPLALYRLSPAAPKGAIKAAPSTPAANNTVAYRLDRHLSDWVTSSGIESARAGVVFVGVPDEFAPAVGAPPLYIPPSATAATDNLLLLHTSWVEAAGGAVEDPEEGVVEVSPLVSYGGEGLEAVVEGKVFEEAYDLDLQGYAPAPGKKLILPHAAITVPLALGWLALAALKVLAKQ